MAILAGSGREGRQSFWSLRKIDIRSPVSAKAWPVARVELEHGERGRVTDLASAPGALDAAFAAVSQIMGVPARVAKLELHYIPADAGASSGERREGTSGSGRVDLGG